MRCQIPILKHPDCFYTLYVSTLEHVTLNSWKAAISCSFVCLARISGWFVLQGYWAAFVRLEILKHHNTTIM